MTNPMLAELDEVVRAIELATPGKYPLGTDAAKRAASFLRTHHATLADMAKRLEAAERECEEQARLNGMGAERELALRARLEAAERDARRYEWLRYAANVSWNGWVTYENLMATEQERAEMDAAIDRAREISPLLPEAVAEETQQ